MKCPRCQQDPAGPEFCDDWGARLAASCLGSGNVKLPWRTRRPDSSIVVLFLTIFTVAVGLAPWNVPDRTFGPVDAEGRGAGLTRTVHTAASTGRQGAYYLPAGYESRPLPLLVFFHGTGGTGRLAILRLQAVAEREGAIVLAPDSVSVAGVWKVGQHPGELTEDYSHVMACVHEVLVAPGVRVDPGRVLAAGFSVGSSAAAYLATHEAVFTGLAVLHGHVVAAAMGPRRPRTWVSAGDRDRVRTVDNMRSVAEQLGHQGFPEVALHVFRAGHTLEDEEVAGLVVWWLGRRAEPGPR